MRRLDSSTSADKTINAAQGKRAVGRWEILQPPRESDTWSKLHSCATKCWQW